MRLIFLVLLAQSLLLASNVNALSSFNPTLVELFVQQQCKNCEGFAQEIVKLRRNPNVLALTFPIINVGKTTDEGVLANQTITQRLRKYAELSRRITVQTPLAVVDGSIKVLNRRKLTDSIDTALDNYEKVLMRMQKNEEGGLNVVLNELNISQNAHRIWLVGYNNAETFEDGKGDYYTIYNVVKSIKALPSSWGGKTVKFSIGAEDVPITDNVALIVQEENLGRIFAATAISLH